MTPTPLRSLSRADAERAAALLDEALDLPPAERATWQAALAAREPRLAAVVAGLLQAAHAPDAAATETEHAALIARRAAAAAPTAGLVGRRFGPYRITALLGQGGMGSVWRATRDDGLFDRDVALKLVHPALSGAALHERFARERRILAALAHPHIARLLDAGVSDDGQPYLALELVDGTPIDRYADEHRWELLARLALFTQVLDAVQHAHQNLVIHRDLKPPNILVDAKGQVRLLDFGIAKLLQAENTEGNETELTRLGGRALTPQYASPEQLAGQPVGTASDVYALGVVLYELLCGQRPAREHPLRPSQLAVDAAAAGRRGMTPQALRKALAGDLDTIVLKALKPDPAERYPTADALRADLQRYRDGRPVLARPDSPIYRLRKFVRRHRAAVAAGTATAALLLIAAGVSLWQAAEARRAAAQAARESERAQAVQAFLIDVFNANTQRQQDPMRARETTARELLDAGAAKATEALQGSPDAQEAVLDVLADLNYQLELYDEAARLRRARAEALARAYGPDDLRVAEAWLSYAGDVGSTALRDQAPAALARARAILDRRTRVVDTAQRSELLGWADIETARQAAYTDLPAMRVAAEAALVRFRARSGPWTDLFHALQVAGRARYLTGEPAAGLPLFAEGVALARQHDPHAQGWWVTPWIQMAECEIALRRVGAAEALFRQAIAAAQASGGERSGSALQARFKLGGLLHSEGRTAEGWQELQKARALLADADPRRTENARSAQRLFVGRALLESGDWAAAHTLLAEEVDDLRAHYPDSLPLSRTLVSLAEATIGQGRLDEGAAALAEARTLLHQVAGPAPAAMFLAPLQAQEARLLAARQAAAASAAGS